MTRNLSPKNLLTRLLAASLLLGASPVRSAEAVPSLEQRLAALVEADQNREALALGEAELKDSPPSAKTYYLLTQAGYGADDYPATRRYALKTIEVDPAHEMAARFFLSACRSMDAYDAGLAFGRAWIEKNPAAGDIYKDLALLADDAGRLEEASGFATEGFKRKPDSARMAGVYFYFRCVTGDTAAGIEAATAWAKAHAADAYFWAQLGKGLSEAEKWAEALPILSRALAEGSDDRGVPDEIMDSYRGLHDRAAAARFIEDYGKTHDLYANLWRMLGAMHYDADAYGEALTAFQKAKKLDPENPVTIANLIFTLVELKRASEGIDEGQRWLNLELDKPTPGLHRAIGNAYFSRSRWLEAEPHYRAAVQLDPTRIHDARELLVTLRKLSRADEAVRFGAEWQAAHPDLQDQGFTDALKEAREAAAAGRTPEAPR